MRKQLLRIAPLALCAAVGSAFADDSSVTLYGTLDASVANIQHSFNFDQEMVTESNPLINHAQHSATGMFSGGLTPSNWGIKGQEDMGSGFKAFFQLESAINIGSGDLSNAALALTHNSADTGPNVAVDSALNGQLFSRGAWVGISSTEFGSLQAGRNTSFFLDNIGQTDPFLGSYAFSPIGFSGAYGGGGYTDDSRVDNSLKYKLTVQDVTLGLLYKFGGVSGSSSSQNAFQANLAWATGPFGIYAGYEQFNDAFSLAGDPAANALSAAAADTKAEMIAGKYTYEPTGTTVRLGYEHESFAPPSNPGNPATAPGGATGDQAITSMFGYTIASVNVYAFYSDKIQNVYWIGGTQDILPNFNMLIAWYHVTQNSYTAGKTGSESCATNGSLCSGATNYYSLAFDYHFSKRTDSYVGIMKTIASGGMGYAYEPTTALPSQAPDNRIIALGLRHRF